MAVYILNELNYKKCRIQHVFLKSKSFWLEVTQQNSETKSIVGVIYRHPDQPTDKKFLETFSNCRHKLSSSKQTYYLIGDFNIDVEKNNRSNTAKTYINTLIANGTVPWITKRTRLTDKTSNHHRSYNYERLHTPYQSCSSRSQPN